MNRLTTCVTRGTHEFYQQRARITKRLIVEKNFNAVAAEADCVYTNILPTGGIRGYGNSEAMCVLELLVDRAAKEIGMDPLEFDFEASTDLAGVVDRQDAGASAAFFIAAGGDFRAGGGRACPRRLRSRRRCWRQRRSARRASPPRWQRSGRSRTSTN